MLQYEYLLSIDVVDLRKFVLGIPKFRHVKNDFNKYFAKLSIAQKFRLLI